MIQQCFISNSYYSIKQVGLFYHMFINPFKPNGISHYYQLDQSISVLRVDGLYFSFLFKF